MATILKHGLHRLLVNGIKYERIDATGSAAEWEMLLFKNEELINYLTNAVAILRRHFASTRTRGLALEFKPNALALALGLNVLQHPRVLSALLFAGGEHRQPGALDRHVPR